MCAPQLTHKCSPARPQQRRVPRLCRVDSATITLAGVLIMVASAVDVSSIGARLEDRFVPLPAWAQFCLDLGMAARRRSSASADLRVALTVPTRLYSACLVAAGSVLAAHELSLSKTGSVDDHFRRLSRLPESSPVLLRDGRKAYRGQLRGVGEKYGAQMVGVQIEGARSGGQVRWLPRARWTSIEIIEDSTEKPLPQHAHGHVVPEATAFLQQVIGLSSISRFLAGGLECAIAGSKTALEADANAPVLSAGRSGCAEIIDGTLAEILQIRELPQAPRTLLLPALSSKHRALKSEIGTVIFDGATSYLRLRRSLSAPVSVAILDRTEVRFEEAADQVDAEFANRVDGLDARAFGEVPDGIEMLAFTIRARR